MRVLLFAVIAFLSLRIYAGERRMAIDGDTPVCNHQKVRLTNVYAVALRPLGHDRYGRTLAEVYVNGRRIEQSDIGPRAGRGAAARGDRHHHNIGIRRRPSQRVRPRIVSR